MTKLVFRADNGEAQEVAIPEGGVTVGRNQTCDLPIVEPSVSGNHGSIRFEHGAWWVHDNSSSNGTFVNDSQVRDSVLKNGDVVKFGNVVATFTSSPEAPAPAVKEAPAPAAVPAPAPVAQQPAASAEPPKAAQKPEINSPPSPS
jgi:pSer/pThr/pTyr-binding forkhead associated (FHA) protein